MMNKRLFSVVLIVLVLAGGALFAFWERPVAKPVPATGADRLAVPEAERVQRARDAETARLNGLAGYYNAKQAREAERLERIRQTEIDRWNAIAEDYFAKQAKEVERLERVRQTEIERWNAIAEDFYARQTQEAQGTR